MLLSLILIAGVAVVEFLPAPDRRPPDIVWIVLDTVRADRVTITGPAPRDTTPFLRAKGASGVVFTAARSPAPWTLPAHASMFTGRLPSEHGCHFEHRFLPEEATTIAEVLRDELGYETAAFSANVNVSRYFNLDQGFQTFYHAFEDPEVTGGKASSEAVLDRALSFLEGGGARPRFAFLNLMDAHLPYDAATGFERFFGDPGTSAPRELLDASDFLDRVLAGEVRLDEDLRRGLELRYDNALRGLDDRLRRFCEALAGDGREERIAFVVTSDHGENLGDHGLVDHQGSLHESLLRVPLVIFGAGVPEGVVVREPVSTARLFGWIQSLARGVFDPPESRVRGLLVSERMRAYPIVERLRAARPTVDPGPLLRRGIAAASADGGWKLLREEGLEDRLLKLDEKSLAETASSDGPLAPMRRELEGALGRRRFVPERNPGGEQPAIPGSDDALRALRETGYLGAGVPGGVSEIHAQEHLSAGNRAFAAGDLERARREYEAAVSIDPGFSPALFNLAGVYERLRPEEAEDAWERYLDAAYREPELDESAIQTAHERLEALRRKK